MDKKRRVVQLCLTGMISLAVLGLSACHRGIPKLVACEGVSNNNEPINMSEGVCKKLAGGIAVSLKCDAWQQNSDSYVCQDPEKNLMVPRYPQSDYVKCYGIAAANMNDCGTATTACGGSVHVDRQADAWIAIPNGLCKKIKGSSSKLDVTAKTASK